MPQPPPDPIAHWDEIHRERAARRDVATTRITRFNRVWIAAQLVAVLLGCAGFLPIWPESWFLGETFRGFLLALVALGVSLLAAGASALVTFWNWSVMPGVWRVVGFAPWSILLMESTFIALHVT